MPECGRPVRRRLILNVSVSQTKMPTIRVATDIGAPPPRCFDLACSVDAHVESAAGTHERAIAGVMTGLLGPGDEVTWRARHLGVSQELASRITVFAANSVLAVLREENGSWRRGWSTRSSPWLAA